jgi:hypothetical protein
MAKETKTKVVYRKPPKKAGHHSRKHTFPVLLLGPPIAMAAGSVARMAQPGQMANGARDLVYQFTGVATSETGAVTIDWSQTFKAGLVIGIGYGLHKIVGPAINRELGRNKVPFIRA